MKGAINVISESIDSGIFNSYDYVIAIQPDVFITDDTYLLEVLYKNLTNDIVFFITKSLPNDERFFSTDFYIFKPKLLTKNILIDELNTFTEYPEYYLCRMIEKHNIKYKFIKRYDNDNWQPRRIDDHLKLYHEHDLSLVETLITKMNTEDAKAKAKANPIYKEIFTNFLNSSLSKTSILLA